MKPISAPFETLARYAAGVGLAVATPRDAIHHRDDRSRGQGVYLQANTGLMTLPATSVRRNRRPLYRYVSRV
jgi:hypothetical protein